MKPLYTKGKTVFSRCGILTVLEVGGEECDEVPPGNKRETLRSLLRQQLLI
jgi:hypothetical protein